MPNYYINFSIITSAILSPHYVVSMRTFTYDIYDLMYNMHLIRYRTQKFIQHNTDPMSNFSFCKIKAKMTRNKRNRNWSGAPP